jgi:hypothetical protein
LTEPDAATGADLGEVAKGDLAKVVTQNQMRIRPETVASADARPGVRAAAKKALESIDLKLRLDAVAETLFFGLSLGAVLVLAAIGLAITFGVMGVINVAHGELIMIGAYATSVS